MDFREIFPKFFSTEGISSCIQLIARIEVYINIHAVLCKICYYSKHAFTKFISETRGKLYFFCMGKFSRSWM